MSLALHDFLATGALFLVALNRESGLVNSRFAVENSPRIAAPITRIFAIG